MPRPCKRRRICALPKCARFIPAECADARQQPINMSVDEFETIRLIDLEGMTQEECAAQMQVARTTAQAIYGSARKKLAQCLVSRRELAIGGGDYVLCDNAGSERCCGHRCGKGCRMAEIEKEK